MKKTAAYFTIPLFLLSCSQNKNDSHSNKIDSAVLVPVSTPAVNKTVPIYTKDIYKKTIPDSAFALLSKLLPEWQLPEPAAWDDMWFSLYQKNGCFVDYLPGDFNGDGKIDYSFLLQRKDQFAVWVLQSDKQSYKAIKLNDVGNINSESKHLEIGIELVAKGKLDYIDFDKDKAASITLKNPALTIAQFESAAATYFWKNDRYQSVTTAD